MCAPAYPEGGKACPCRTQIPAPEAWPHALEDCQDKPEDKHEGSRPERTLLNLQIEKVCGMRCLKKRRKSLEPRARPPSQRGTRRRAKRRVARAMGLAQKTVFSPGTAQARTTTSTRPLAAPASRHMRKRAHHLWVGVGCALNVRHKAHVGLDNTGLVSQSGTCHPIASQLPWWQRKVSPSRLLCPARQTPLQPRTGQDQQQRKAPWNFRKSRRSMCSSPGFRDCQRTKRYRLVAMQSTDMQILRVLAFML